MIYSIFSFPSVRIQELSRKLLMAAEIISKIKRFSNDVQLVISKSISVWYSDRKQTTIWEYDRPKSSKEHPTMKPIALMAYPIQNSCMSNCIVLDPFLGSGSTLIACEQTGRICYGIELEEKFVDVIVNRYMEQRGSVEDISVIRDGKTIKYSELIKGGVSDEADDLP